MEDVFVDLEHNKPSSTAFWFLWDLYEPTLSNGWFVQAVYDGCVGPRALAPHLGVCEKPSKSDRDPVYVTDQAIVDCDIMCCYLADGEHSIRPIGRVRHGSYGLLGRSAVDVHCSGRTPQDFAVLNNRWATSATGSEALFTITMKNPYEERIFLMEGERVQLYSRICRMMTTLERLGKLRMEIEGSENPGSFLNTGTFLREIMTGTQILTHRPLYDRDLT
jgi:hypothetical protein